MTDLPFAVGAQFLLGQFHTLPGTNYGCQFLTKELIRDAEYLHISNFGMTNKKLFDLDGENVFAAANDHVFETAHNVDIAAFVHGGEVAGMQPSLVINRLC